jgi:hypothetical protein
VIVSRVGSPEFVAEHIPGWLSEEPQDTFLVDIQALSDTPIGAALSSFYGLNQIKSARN